MIQGLIQGECIEHCKEVYGYADALFLRDFGPWRKGYVAKYLWFRVEKNLLEEQRDGLIVNKHKYELCSTT